MSIRIREMSGVRATAGDPTEDDIAVLSGEEFAGKAVSAEDVTIRQMLLCHDQYDRTYERFPKSYLNQFVQTLPGKSVLACHDSGGWGGGAMALPLARFFRTNLTSKSEMFPVPVTGRRRQQRRDEGGGVDEKGDAIPNFQEQERRVTYLKAGFYFANDPANESLRKNIDLGVFKWVSIGFRYDDMDCDICQTSYLRSECPHILGWETEEGQLCTGTYSGDPKKAEALEGSIVYLGAQPRARLIKQAQEGQVDPASIARTPYGDDLVLLKEAEAMAKEFGHKQKNWHMGIDLAKGESLTDLTFDDHSRAVLTAVEEYTDRAKLLASRRAKDGRQVTEVRRQTWKEMRDQLDTLYASSEPVTGGQAVRALEAELLRHELDINSLLIGV